ncbi:MAG TPA: zinc ABC transporter substrate-binding protein [Dokdonella sp.]|uniref:metal ABC transporter substrate-binding protein n=1 Tax=Dokdonella sp. TaxID=2291710 RepID=UPI002D80F9CD|nr:zinc ABC transporter substrate-binding protein [Dokdonella sp.]HET9031755.1 zinc ABC transporter substrate-binding protein [Dokdonella sp.]
MRKMLFLMVAIAAVISTPVQAKLRVFACEPEWASLLNELAGDAITVDIATNALQDVHVVEARPSLIAKMRRADLLVCTGAQLEIGWLPQLLRQAGNTKVSAGAGHFMAASQVTTLEKPASIDRSAGDVHPDGNPHVQLDPYRVLAIAKALGARLAELDAANATTYQQRLGDFETRWQAAIKAWEAKAAPLKGKSVIVYHSSWVYLLQWLGMHEIGSLEPKPGVPPTSSHLSSLIDVTKSGGAIAIISAAYQDRRPGEWLSERTSVPAVVLPFTVGGDDQAKDLFGLYDSTIDKLLGALK